MAITEQSIKSINKTEDEDKNKFGEKVINAYKYLKLLSYKKGVLELLRKFSENSEKQVPWEEKIRLEKKYHKRIDDIFDICYKNVAEKFGNEVVNFLKKEGSLQEKEADGIPCYNRREFIKENLGEKYAAQFWEMENVVEKNIDDTLTDKFQPLLADGILARNTVKPS